MEDLNLKFELVLLKEVKLSSKYIQTDNSENQFFLENSTGSLGIASIFCLKYLKHSNILMGRSLPVSSAHALEAATFFITLPLVLRLQL